VTSTDTHRAIDAVWRIESARIIAGLTRMVRDVRRRAASSLRRFGFVDMRVLPLTATEFPANLTRVGVIARKS